jgi:hypothetical protein
VGASHTRSYLFDQPSNRWSQEVEARPKRGHDHESRKKEPHSISKRLEYVIMEGIYSSGMSSPLDERCPGTGVGVGSIAVAFQLPSLCRCRHAERSTFQTKRSEWHHAGYLKRDRSSSSPEMPASSLDQFGQGPTRGSLGE